MIINYDQAIAINHNPDWPYIPDHPYKILIIDGSKSGKTNMLRNLIKHQLPDIDKIYLYVKYPVKTKYYLVINGREKLETENLKNPNAFIDHSQTGDGAYEKIEDYNPTKKKRLLKLF